MIHYPKTFNKASPAGFDGIFDWDFLLPVFEGTKIEPMDIDAVIERKGKFLIFETKTCNKEIPNGQRITLEGLIKLGKGNVTVMIIYGKTSDTITNMEEWHYKNGKTTKIMNGCCDRNYVLSRVSAWFQWANKNM